MAICENLTRGPKQLLREIGWTKVQELRIGSTLPEVYVKPQSRQSSQPMVSWHLTVNSIPAALDFPPHDNGGIPDIEKGQKSTHERLIFNRWTILHRTGMASLRYFSIK